VYFVVRSEVLDTCWKSREISRRPSTETLWKPKSISYLTVTMTWRRRKSAEYPAGTYCTYNGERTPRPRKPRCSCRYFAKMFEKTFFAIFAPRKRILSVANVLSLKRPPSRGQYYWQYFWYWQYYWSCNVSTTDGTVSIEKRYWRLNEKLVIKSSICVYWR